MAETKARRRTSYYTALLPAAPRDCCAPDQADVPEKPWDVRVLEQIPSGVDVSLLERNLALTPTERVLNMVRILELREAARAGRDR